VLLELQDYASVKQLCNLLEDCLVGIDKDNSGDGVAEYHMGWYLEFVVCQPRKDREVSLE
jgi:hypothetical protein